MKDLMKRQLWGIHCCFWTVTVASPNLHSLCLLDSCSTPGGLWMNASPSEPGAEREKMAGSGNLEQIRSGHVQANDSGWVQRRIFRRDAGALATSLVRPGSKHSSAQHHHRCHYRCISSLFIPTHPSFPCTQIPAAKVCPSATQPATPLVSPILPP